MAIFARANSSAGLLVPPIDEVVSRSEGIIHRARVPADEEQCVPEQRVFLVPIIGAFGLVALILAAIATGAVATVAVTRNCSPSSS